MLSKSDTLNFKSNFYYLLFYCHLISSKMAFDQINHIKASTITNNNGTIENILFISKIIPISSKFISKYFYIIIQTNLNFIVIHQLLKKKLTLQYHNTNEEFALSYVKKCRYYGDYFQFLIDQ